MPNFSIHLPPELVSKADNISNSFEKFSRSKIFTVLLKHLDENYIKSVIESYGYERKLETQAQ